jgi:phosphopantothenoylcysteine decarboxylase/phosphopantothenate--cysteine ligase
MKKNNKIKSASTKRLKDRAVEIKSSELKGKQIALAVCGGIACVETIKIIRELRRSQAEVTAFYTPDVKKFMTELPVEWATGKSVVTEPQANVDHLESFDLVIVAPATLNTIAKSALGLSDNVVTLLISSQIGKKGKVLFVPAMNWSLKQHPLFETYSKLLMSWGAEFLISQQEEDRIKIPSPEELLLKTTQMLKLKKV